MRQLLKNHFTQLFSECRDLTPDFAQILPKKKGFFKKHSTAQDGRLSPFEESSESRTSLIASLKFVDRTITTINKFRREPTPRLKKSLILISITLPPSMSLNLPTTKAFCQMRTHHWERELVSFLPLIFPSINLILVKRHSTNHCQNQLSKPPPETTKSAAPVPSGVEEEDEALELLADSTEYHGEHRDDDSNGTRNSDYKYL